VIAERLGVQPSSPSFHLAQLVHADLITQRCLSRQLIYSVSGSGVSMTALGHEHELVVSARHGSFTLNCGRSVRRVAARLGAKFGTRQQ
jgi:hypothetical protein